LKFYLIASLFCLTCLTPTRPARSQPVADRLLHLLPEQTCHLVVVNRFADIWRLASAQSTSSSRGQLLDLENTAQNFQDQLGLAPALLAELSPSEMVHAEIVDSDNVAQCLLVARVADRELAANILARSRIDLERSEARVRSVRLGGVSGTQYTWDTAARASRTIIHIVARDLLIGATDASLAADIVGRMSVSSDDAGSDLPGAGAIVSHLVLPESEDQPSLFWYSNPWRVAESAGAADAKPDTWYARHGLKRIQALGGTVTCPSTGAWLAQTVVVAPPPREGSLGILQLRPTAKWNPPEWLCAEFDELVLLHGDVPKAFESFGTIFDDLYADGIEGTYEAILEDLRDESGLNIDLKTQLFEHLGPLVVLVRDPPPREGAEAPGAITYAIQAQQPEAVALAIETLFQDDPEARRISVPGCEEPFWLISGDGESPDSGLVVTRGYMTYAEDAASLRRALAAKPATRPTIVERITELGDSLPAVARRPASMFWMDDRGIRPEATVRNAANADAVRLFLAPSPRWSEIRVGDRADFVALLTNFTPLFQHFSFGLGFNEEDGWSLFAK
jgi:hypothetical protein